MENKVESKKENESDEEGESEEEQKKRRQKKKMMIIMGKLSMPIMLIWKKKIGVSYIIHVYAWILLYLMILLNLNYVSIILMKFFPLPVASGSEKTQGKNFESGCLRFCSK